MSVMSGLSEWWNNASPADQKNFDNQAEQMKADGKTDEEIIDYFAQQQTPDAYAKGIEQAKQSTGKQKTGNVMAMIGGAMQDIGNRGQGPSATMAAAKSMQEAQTGRVDEFKDRQDQIKDYLKAKGTELKAVKDAAIDKRKVDQKERELLLKEGKIVVVGLPDGYYRKANDPSGQIFNPDGEKASGEEVEAASVRGKKAGASSVTVGGEDTTGQTIPDGALIMPGIKSTDRVKATQGVVSNSRARGKISRLGELYETLLSQSDIDPDATKFAADFSAFLLEQQNNPLVREYNMTKKQLAGDILRSQKGPQTDQDYKRALDELSNLSLGPAAHRNAINAIGAANEQSLRMNQAIMKGWYMPGALDYTPIYNKPGSNSDKQSNTRYYGRDENGNIVRSK